MRRVLTSVIGTSRIDLYSDENLHVAGAAGDSQGNFFSMAVEHQVETGVSNRKVPNLDPFKELRKDRAGKPDDAPRRVDLHA